MKANTVSYTATTIQQSKQTQFHRNVCINYAAVEAGEEGF